MTGLTDTARFLPTDPDELVMSALACPLCLGSEPVQWTAALEGYDPFVECRCLDCAQGWRVYLAPEQALRFALLPVHSH